MVYDDFGAFMREAVLPRRDANPNHIRLDGLTTGGSRDVAGKFRHNDLTWVVHADTHYEPLLLALGAYDAGGEPFVEEHTRRGRSLALSPALREKQTSTPKYLYIYSWAGKTDGTTASD